jgi:hypothetical protein
MPIIGSILLGQSRRSSSLQYAVVARVQAAPETNSRDVSGNLRRRDSQALLKRYPSSKGISHDPASAAIGNG